MNHLFMVAACSALLPFGAAFAELPSASDYAVVNKVGLTGEGGWDYCALDDATSRLFVSHEMQVHVVDVSTRQQIGLIPDTKGVHGITFARDMNKAYITDGKDTSVTVVDFKTLAVIKKVHVTGVGPDAILYDPFSKYVYVFNGKTENATVIDAKSDHVFATIALNGKPEFPSTDCAGTIYDNLEDKGEVAVINTKTMKVEKRWSVAPASEPCAMAIDTADHRLFIGCRSQVLVVMDATSGKIVASEPIGDHVDAVAFDPALQRIFCSQGNGTVTVIQRSSNDTYKSVENIVTQKGAKTMALSLKSHHLYLPTAEYDVAAAATADNPKPKAKVKPGSFEVLEIAPVSK